MDAEVAPPPSTSSTARSARRPLESLGPHTTGVGCIYLKDLGDVDLDVLETIVARSYAALTAATSSGRALGGTHR